MCEVLLFGIACCQVFIQVGVALLGAIDPGCGGSFLRFLPMHEVRKFLEFEDSVVGCVNAHWFALGARKT
ncbi:hypothetical protein Nepgr_023969 [Nepenthes gracilis]|uniref:Uncharacterized protein n=1 Tax=Nepenthes gracilis TaxID=150966 RepID=A0AAD3Y007_NEPGR|nr:hypothetical protein Nepgr_023969 [Nepenthes gracilis]